jgi:subfamily B ATP-binding cassette protein MsbA
MLLLRKALFERAGSEMGLFGRQSASALSNTVVYEVQNGSNLLVQALLGLSRDGFTLIALLGYLLYLNWQLTLIVAVVVPGVAWIMKTCHAACIHQSQPAGHRRTGLCGGGKRAGPPHGAPARCPAKQASRFGALSQSCAPGDQIHHRLSRHDAADPSCGRRSLVAVICIALWQSRGWWTPRT